MKPLNIRGKILSASSIPHLKDKPCLERDLRIAAENRTVKHAIVAGELLGTRTDSEIAMLLCFASPLKTKLASLKLLHRAAKRIGNLIITSDMGGNITGFRWDNVPEKAPQWKSMTVTTVSTIRKRKGSRKHG